MKWTGVVDSGGPYLLHAESLVAIRASTRFRIPDLGFTDFQFHELAGRNREEWRAD